LIETLNHIGYDPNKDLPIVAKLKDDVSKFNDKQEIIRKIAVIEKKLNFEADKKQFIWIEDENQLKEESLDEKIGKTKHHKVQVFQPEQVTFVTSSSVDGKMSYFDKLDSISVFIERKFTQQNHMPTVYQETKKMKSSKKLKRISAIDSKSSESSSFLSKLMLQEELGEDFDEPVDFNAEKSQEYAETDEQDDNQTIEKLQLNQRSIEQTIQKEKQGKVGGSTGIRTPNSQRITTIQEE